MSCPFFCYCRGSLVQALCHCFAISTHIADSQLIYDTLCNIWRRGKQCLINHNCDIAKAMRVYAFIRYFLKYACKFAFVLQIWPILYIGFIQTPGTAFGWVNWFPAKKGIFPQAAISPCEVSLYKCNKYAMCRLVYSMYGTKAAQGTMMYSYYIINV